MVLSHYDVVLSCIIPLLCGIIMYYPIVIPLMFINHGISHGTPINPAVVEGIPGMGGGFAKQGPPWRKATEKVFNEAPELRSFGEFWVDFFFVMFIYVYEFILILKKSDLLVCRV